MSWTVLYSEDNELCKPVYSRVLMVHPVDHIMMHWYMFRIISRRLALPLLKIRPLILQIRLQWQVLPDAL